MKKILALVLMFLVFGMLNSPIILAPACTSGVDCLGWQGGVTADCGVAGTWNDSDTTCIVGISRTQACR